MSTSHKIVAHEAQRVAAELPQESIEAIATVLVTVNVDSWPTARRDPRNDRPAALPRRRRDVSRRMAHGGIRR
jgi:hypothetical protein